MSTFTPNKMNYGYDNCHRDAESVMLYVLVLDFSELRKSVFFLAVLASV